MRALFKLIAAVAMCVAVSHGQVVPISGQVINQYGAPLSFAKVRVCSVTSTGTPCTPTTPIYLDYGLTVPAGNPYSADQYGNYTVYAPGLATPNLYVVEVSPASGLTWSYVVNGPSPLGNGSDGVQGTIQSAGATPGTFQAASSQTLSSIANGLLHFNAIDVFGDSTFAGEGPATAPETFPNQLNRDVPGQLRNYAISGALTNQIAMRAWAGWDRTDIFYTTLVPYQGAINDADSGVLDNPGGLANGLNSILAGVSHIAIPIKNQQLSSTATSSSGWTSANSIFTVSAANTGTWQQSTTNGNTVTYTLPSGASVFYWWGVQDGNTGTFSVTLNGVLQTNTCTGTTTWINYGCNGQNIIAGGAHAMGAQLLTGHTSSANLLVVTVTSATGAGNIVYDGGAATVPSSLGPNVIAMQGLQKQAGDLKSQATADFDAVITNAYGILRGAGLTNIFRVDERNGVSPGLGYPGARAANTTTDYAVTIDCPGPTNGAGTTPLHMQGCGVENQVLLYENAAAAAGFPIAIHNIGSGSAFPGPIQSTGLGFPGQTDYRDDWKIGDGRYNNAVRMPGVIYNAGANGLNANTDAGARIVFEHAFDAAIADDAFKFNVDNANRPYAWCTALPGAPIASDYCSMGFYPGSSPSTGGLYYKSTVHLGAIGGWNGINVVPGVNLAVALDAQQAVTSAALATATVVYLEAGTTSLILPRCSSIIGQNAANWIEFIHKDSADTGSITFSASTGDTVNGVTSQTYSAVPNYAMWTVQCSQGTATTGNVSMVESLPVAGSGKTIGTATLTSGTSTVSTSAACTIGASCTYKLQNCGINASTAIGTLTLGTVAAGTSFVINSRTATATIATGDASSVCWQVN